MKLSKDHPTANRGIPRRQFLLASALAVGGVAITGCVTSRPRRLRVTDKLSIGIVGVSGKGGSDTDCCASENIVALCDVDEAAAVGPRKKHPGARFYTDFRRMLEREKSLDAVVVSTPDHVHAAVAALALRLGKHVYCQKPLTQTIYEARLLRELATKHRVATQMGNQGSAEDGLRRAVEVVQSGFIGPVRQIYVWSNRPIWPQGMDRPAGSDPVPTGLNWDLWLGPAPWRPFKLDGEYMPSDVPRKNRRGVYHSFNWRGWQDFGTGALGDMACHTMNLPFRALNLGYPNEVEAEHSGINRETYPLKSRIRFLFPAREGLPAVTLWWLDGGDPKRDNPYRHDGHNKPPKEVTVDIVELLDKVPDSGCLMIGDRGTLFSPDAYGARFFVKLNAEKEFSAGDNHEGIKAIPQSVPRNPMPNGAADLRHHQEWILACKDGRPTYSDFGIASRLTETILLGALALRAGGRI